MIVDGTGRQPFRGNIGVKDKKIVSVGDLGLASARTEKDISNHYVIPGIIDAHTHGDLQLLRKPVNLIKLKQGVTCEIVGNCGFSLAPCASEDGSWQDLYINILGRTNGIAEGALDFPEYLDRLEDLPLGQHCAAIIGTGAVRAMVKGMSRGPMSAGERARAHSIVKEAMRAGAVGLSSGLVYPPDCYSDEEDLLSMVSGLTQSQRPYVVHIRGEGTQLLHAIREAIDIANRAQVPLHISHFKAMGANSWNLLDDAINLIEDARDRGQDITCDCYPYTGGATTMTALLPPWVMEGGAAEAVNRLTDTKLRCEIVDEMQEKSDKWDNVVLGVGWNNVIVTSAAHAKWHDFCGETIQQIASCNDMEPVDAFLDILADSHCDVSCVHMSMRMEDVGRILCLPYVFVASDSLYVPENALHPRVWGTFARVLHWALAGKKLSLSDAVMKMTSMPADRFGLTKRGVLAENQWADMTVFSKNIEDTATYQNPMMPPKGIAQVYLEGQLIIENGNYCDKEPHGKLLRAGQM